MCVTRSGVGNFVWMAYTSVSMGGGIELWGLIAERFLEICSCLLTFSEHLILGFACVTAIEF